MRWRVKGESAVANGFAARRSDFSGLLSTGAAVAGLGAPLIGATYGVVRVGYEDYYDGLGLSPEDVRLGQAAIVSRVAVLVGFAFLLVATLAAFAVVIHRLTGPLTSRVTAGAVWYVQLGWMLAPFLVLVITASASGLVLAWLGGGTTALLWAVSAVSVGIIVVLLNGFASQQRDVGDWGVRVIRSVYDKGLPKVGWLLIAAMAGGYLTALVDNFWKSSWRAGQKVKETGQLSADYLNVTVTPARIIPKDGDHLGVCDGSRRAVLVGRNDDTSFVLMLPSRDGDESEVFPLKDMEYAVTTATAEPQTCGTKVP